MIETGATNPVGNQLCLACGLCCSGVLFRDVELQPADDAVKLQALGLPLERLRRKIRFAQPCAALGRDCRCAVYPDRPLRCRQFDCALLNSVLDGGTTVTDALGVIRKTRKRVDDVLRLMHELGETSHQLPLAKRFRRIRRRFERRLPDEETAEIYARLTLAVHDLNLLLRTRFYRG